MPITVNPRVPGHIVGSKVAQALGLDPNRVKKVELVVEPHEAAYWRVEVYYLTEEEGLLGDVDLREPAPYEPAPARKDGTAYEDRVG